MTINSICILLVLKIFSNNFLSLSCSHSNFLRAFPCPFDLFSVQAEPIPTVSWPGAAESPSSGEGLPLNFYPKAAVPSQVTQCQIQLPEYNIQVFLSLICHLAWEAVSFLNTSMSGKWRNQATDCFVTTENAHSPTSVNNITWTIKTEYRHLY